MAPLSDPRRELVRRGYDQAAASYHAARTLDGPDVALLVDLHQRLRPGARILDVGCGAGVPVARRLTELGHEVVGLDLSMAQLVLARDQVPDLRIVAAEMSALPITSSAFHALVSYYAVIHVPREDHAAVFDEFRRVLQPGGWVLVCVGSDDNPEDRDAASWLGTPMYWSHFDAETTLALVSGARFRVEDSWEIRDPMEEQGSHRFVLAQAT
jgi:cyclopropane fatty-acyl-phospholipid synthase-like methyltransferase